MAGAELFEVPNLDGLSVDPADLDEAARVFRLLAEYARCKAIAMRLRQRGAVADAIEYERTGDSYYRQLPMWARW